MSRKLQGLLFAVSAVICITLLWNTGFRLPRLLPVGPPDEVQVWNAAMMQVSAAAQGPDCDAALAEVRRICKKALTGQLAAQ